MTEQLSVFDLFTVGIGPSSSHTVGPMRAAAAFAAELADTGVLARVATVGAHLYGSLAATGAGHGTLEAVLAGLEGADPAEILPEAYRALLDRIRDTGVVHLDGTRPVLLGSADIALHPLTRLPRHTNGMRFDAFDTDGRQLATGTWYSVGGGVDRKSVV